MHNLDLAVIGNCQVSALLSGRGEIVWCCLPRFDGDPMFCSLLQQRDDHQALGEYTVDLVNFERAEQNYIDNTAIVETRLYDKMDNAVRITDFAPRFHQYGRMFRPVMLVRCIEPLQGSPQIKVRLNPRYGYGKHVPTTTQGSNHIRYITPDLVVRLTTDMSINTLLEQQPFVLEEKLTLLLGPDETIPESVPQVGRRFFEETKDEWREWVRGLNIPFEWQDAVIRAAITLKLCTFEDTGAIVAAMTTSIPEAPNSGRNWDYRYCWLRDSYFVIQALNRLGATKTMEAFLHYIINIAASADGHRLQPVYGISGQWRLSERIVESLEGYRAMGPVRLGNQAYEQVQNDVYGSVVLASAHAFVDRRLAKPGDTALFERMEHLGAAAAKLYNQADAGLWEYRGRAQIHTFSSVMCWAACDRLAKIAHSIGTSDKTKYWRQQANRIHKTICERAWDPEQNSFTQSFGDAELDAALLLLHELGFLSAQDPRFLGTVKAIEKQLRRGSYLFRYSAADDFGEPETAFNICTFWYIDTLAMVGRRDEARELFENMLAYRNSLGLLSEDLDPVSHELWGNFPQTYSMVGIINAAMRLSKSWEEAF